MQASKKKPVKKPMKKKKKKPVPTFEQANETALARFSKKY